MNNTGTKIAKILTQSKKYFHKAYMISTKIKFGEQCDHKTAEIKPKEFQATIYIPDGANSPYKPAIALSLKLGNQAMSLYVDSSADLEKTIADLATWIFRNREKIDAAHHAEINQYYKMRESELKDRSDILPSKSDVPEVSNTTVKLSDMKAISETPEFRPLK